MADVNLRVLLSAVGGAGVIQAVQSVASAITGGGGLTGVLAGVGVAAAGLAVGLGVTAVNASSDFQTAMLQNVAHAGLAANQVDSVTNALMQMGPAVGQGPTALAQALYPILSSFSGMTDQAGKAQLSLATLNDAAKSVAGSTTSVSDVTGAATAVFNAYGFATGNATRDTQIMHSEFDMMNTTVSAGNMRWSDYSTVIGKLSVASHAAGVSFNEENAALADLTNSGYSAQLAGTYLSNTFNDLYIKADNIAKNAGRLGISFDETKYKTMNLGDKIRYLSQVTDGNQTSLLKMLGGNSVALKTFDALSNSIDAYSGNLTALQHAQGATATAFETSSQGFGMAMQRLQSAGQALLITIGNQLLPTLTNLANQVLPVISSFTSLFNSGSSLSPIFQNISGMLMIMAANWQDFAASTGPASKALQQFGQLLSSALPGFVSQGLRELNLLWLAFLTIASGAMTIAKPALQILGQIILGVQHATEPVLNAIEGRFLPALQNLVGAVAPVVASILSWIAQSNIIPIIFNVIGNTVSTVVNILSGLVNGIANVTTFFAKNQAAADLLLIPLGILGGYFVFLGVSAIASFLFAAPAMIAGFIAGAAAAWTMAAGVLAATWPFLLIGAAIGAVIAIVVLLVQHWTQVVGFFAWVWNGILVGLRAVGAFFVAVWNGIINALHVAWNAIIGAIRAYLTLLLNVFLFPFRAIGALFQWLYAHNTYFQRLVDAIRHIVQVGLTWLHTAWTVAIAFLVGLWQGIVSKAQQLWGVISGAISTAVNTAVGWLKDAWNTAIGWLAGVWNTLSGLANKAWQAVSGVFSGIWQNYIAGPLGNMWNQFSNWFGDLAKQALQWGANLIQQFINGIKNAAGNVGNAVQGVVKNVASFLGFHSPAEQGPGADADTWAPNLIKMYAQGLQTAAPQLQTSLALIMKPIASSLSGNGTPSVSTQASPLLSRSGPGAGNSTVVHNWSINLSTMARSPSEVSRLVDMFEQELSQRLRRSGVLSSVTSGGKAV